MNPDIFGYIAATLTTLCFVPQAIKVLKSDSAEGVSLPMYVAFTIGIGFWLVYSIILESPPMILSNACTIVLALTILLRLIYLRFKKTN